MCGKGRTWWTTVGLVVGTLLTGCGRDDDGGGVGEPAPVPNAAVASPDPAASPALSGDEQTRLHLPFGEATRVDPPPADQHLSDMTITGKSVGKLFVDVTKVWNDIRFLSPAGKRLHYKAVLDTVHGEIEITLRPDLAPNHVRSFLALCKVGYYDGMLFERTIREEDPEKPDTRFELLEAGCPAGTGDQGYGSLGYWLPRELSTSVTHEEGTVGAAHGEDPDSAACKFYITLCKAPMLDGEFTIFGKVTRGLDVARTILTQPVRYDAEYPEGDRPVNPVVIRKVTIHVQETE